MRKGTGGEGGRIIIGWRAADEKAAGAYSSWNLQGFLSPALTYYYYDSLIVCNLKGNMEIWKVPFFHSVHHECYIIECAAMQTYKFCCGIHRGKRSI